MRLQWMMVPLASLHFQVVELRAENVTFLRDGALVLNSHDAESLEDEFDEELIAVSIPESSSTEGYIRELEDLYDAEPVAPLSNGSYLVLLTKPSLRDFVRFSSQVRVARFNQFELAQRKLSADLRNWEARLRRRKKQVRVSVLTVPLETSAKNIQEFVKRFPGVSVKTFGSSPRIEMDLSFDQLTQIVRHPRVLSIDPVQEIGFDMANVRSVTGADGLEQLIPEGLSGNGVTIEVVDDGLYRNHGEFLHQPSLFLTSEVWDAHGTLVNGILFSEGLNPEAKGMVPWAQGVFRMISEFILDPFGSLASSIHQHDVSIQTRSWGSGSSEAYTTVAAELDALLFQFDIVVTQSQGNTGSQFSRPQAWAKNVISVGGICHHNNNDRTDDHWGPVCVSGAGSVGPAADGRIKPDLSAYYDDVLTTNLSPMNPYMSFTGTSASTPIVAGAFGLVFEMWTKGMFKRAIYRDGTGRNLSLPKPHASTARALVINTAYRYPFDQADFDRFNQGWGMPDLLELHRLSRDLLNGGLKRIFVLDSDRPIHDGQVHSYKFRIPQGEDLPFRVTLVYKDPMGLPIAPHTLINDLDLQVVNILHEQTVWGNAGLESSNESSIAGQPDDKNPVENVFLSHPEPGEFLVNVFARSIGKDAFQETPDWDVIYSLVVTGGVLDPQAKVPRDD